ncbi:hypothetical protein JCM10212_004139 [Sporobolomyces blumeae]
MKYDYRASTIEQDRKAAQDVWDRVERNRTRSSGDSRAGQGNAADDDGHAQGQDAARQEEGDDRDRQKAVQLMQAQYRAHVTRRTAKGHNLSSSKRFEDGLLQRKLDKASKEQYDGKNDSASRWQRSAVYASKLGQGNSTKDQELLNEPSEEEEMNQLGRNEKERNKIQQERKESKAMESQYWLEMVDHKHRYGSNLKYYHQRWNETDTDENFFQWLDEGEGKHLDLEQCPRSRLDKERITYLSAEQREVYRVIVNDDGLLVWAKDGSLLDTSKYHEDLGPDKGGVVEISEERFKEKQAEDKERIKRAKEREGSSASSSDFGSSSSSSDEEVDVEVATGAKPYGDKGGTAGQGKGLHQFKKRVQYYSSISHVTDHVLRRTINKNTWLYVSDLTNGLFVSIKKTGGFQHSSFLYGARVTSAGLLKASDGKLTSLSPLSGHYRAGTMHFKAFVRGLEEQGVDMSSVSISKSVMTIRGIEKYGHFTKRKKELGARLKAAVTGSKTPEEEQRDEAEQKREKIRDDEGGRGDASDRFVKGKQGREGDERDGNDGDAALPGDGKDASEMTEEEKMDRGLALLVRAFERGLRREVEHEGQKERGAPGGGGEGEGGGPKVNAAT